MTDRDIPMHMSDLGGENGMVTLVPREYLGPAYVSVQDAPIAMTQELYDGRVIADFAMDGSLVGIEILHPISCKIGTHHMPLRCTTWEPKRWWEFWK